jgi:hypothetical protein
MKHLYQVSFNVKTRGAFMGSMKVPYSSRNVIARDAMHAALKVEHQEIGVDYGGVKSSAVQVVEVKLVAAEVS